MRRRGVEVERGDAVVCVPCGRKGGDLWRRAAGVEERQVACESADGENSLCIHSHCADDAPHLSFSTRHAVTGEQGSSPRFPLSPRSDVNLTYWPLSVPLEIEFRNEPVSPGIKSIGISRAEEQAVWRYPCLGSRIDERVASKDAWSKGRQEPYRQIAGGGQVETCLW